MPNNIVFNFENVETKWRKLWFDNNIYSPDLKEAKNPFYNLMMFPYPSAEGLHVGNMYAFTGADVFGRFNRMQGKDVFEPIGLDGFGIHSENYAIKVGRHPAKHAEVSKKNFYRQLSQIGDGFAWDFRLETYDPEYYKWTQWIFVQMFKKGLAYKGKAMVNWCPSCKTVLADEQVVEGACERCGTKVERREMSSWFFRITDYADRLLQNIDGREGKSSSRASFGPQGKDYDVKRYGLIWPEKIKIAQRQWIGKSRGLSIKFPGTTKELQIEVWTKFWETIFGATFLVVAPEYAKEKLLGLVPRDYLEEVDKYIKISLNKSEQERKANKEKTGVNTGIFVNNPATAKDIPVYVSDYVLMDVGTGAVMGVPAHDLRDFDFAKKYNMPILQVVSYKDQDLDKKVREGKVASEEYGVLVNSGEFNGFSSLEEGKTKMADWMIKKGLASWKIHYHLRDWLISRQRYWGPPIPMVNCDKCGWQPVPEEDLPVLLPEIKDFKPKGDGTSPLYNAPESWKKVECPNCGNLAQRELEVSDTFLDSSWYFLAYPNLKTKEWKSGNNPFNNELTKKWLPVDAYIGGAEHAVLHLLYARFVTMVLNDLGYLSFEEPFPFLFGHGLLIKDGAKMSKSKGNVVVPDDYIKKFGADSLRLYLMFLGPFDQGGDFRDTGIQGMKRFVNRVWRLFVDKRDFVVESEKDAKEILVKMHQTIKKVTQDTQNFRYNTAIAAIMEFVNLLEEKTQKPISNTAKTSSMRCAEWDEALKTLSLLLAPFAPFLTEEIWQTYYVSDTKRFDSIHFKRWPTYDESISKSKESKIVVQVNGKLRATLDLDPSVSSHKDQVEKAAKEDISKWLQGKKIEKIVFVPGKLINFVTS